MFIKLTKFDNRPIWLNAGFIVTVEPRRDGTGAVVVPIGDGLDYDVKESPEEVLKMLEGVPAPAVVPVPVSDCLTKTPEDVSPEPERERPEPANETAPAVSAASEKPRKRAARAKARPAVQKALPAPKAPPAPKKEDPPVKEPGRLEMSDDQIARLVKLAPKSVAKLKNTLATQFQIADVSATVTALAAKGVFTLDDNRVKWPGIAEAASAPVADW